jgi:hypothetical protein
MLYKMSKQASVCIKYINEYSSNDDIDSFFSILYNCWINRSNKIYEDPSIINLLRQLLTIQSGKYTGYPNKTYIKLLYRVVSFDIIAIRNDNNLEDFRKFLISFFIYLEENAITGIVNVKNKNIIDRLINLENELDLRILDTSTISNTHIIMLLQ